MASGIQITAEIKDVVKRLGTMPERLAAARKEALGDAAKYLYGEILPKLPKRSGIMSNSLWYDTPDDHTAEVGYLQAPGGKIPIYFYVREFGPKGGVIRAKNKPFLFFAVGGAAITKAGVGGISYGEALGGGYAHKTKWRRVKEVKQKGGFYLTKTTAKKRKVVETQILDALRKAIEAPTP